MAWPSSRLGAKKRNRVAKDHGFMVVRFKVVGWWLRLRARANERMTRKIKSEVIENVIGAVPEKR